MTQCHGCHRQKALLETLAAQFPARQLLLDPAALSAWAATTHPLAASPTAVVAPLSTLEVAEALRIAGRAGVPAMAISRGRNIGMGGRIPPQAEGEALIIDLQAMARIRALDERFGVVTLEPGVTFETLHRVLREAGSRWFLPTTGGPPDGSVLGNLLQRGDGAGPHGDRARAFLDLEAVLPTGEVVYTRRDGAGPDISGLFFQSDAAVVTAVSLSLVALPAVMTRFVMRLAPGGRLAGLVDGVAAALRDGVLAPNAVSLWNGTKRMIRDGGDIASQRQDDWILSGALHGASLARARADWDDLRAALAAAGETPEILLHDVRERPDGHGLLAGEPSDANLVSIVSGLAQGVGRPGFAWLCPMLPFDGAAVEAVMRMVTEELAAAGVPPNLALGSRDARTVRGYIALAWDRENSAAEARALAAHDRMLARLDAAGLPLFRLGQLSRHWAASGRGDTKAVVARLLAALAA